MLRKLNRDDRKPLKEPHPNKIKNTTHNFSIGYSDFPADRQKSTKAYFYGNKDRIENKAVGTRSNHSQFELGHSKSGQGFETSMTRNDFAPYKYSSTPQGNDQKGRNFTSSIYKTSDPKETFGYPTAFKTSNSLLQRDRDAINIAEKVHPPKSKADLLKTQFEITSGKDFRLKSNYGETYTGATTSQLPPLGYRHNTRDYNILTNASKPLQSTGWPRDKYERFDCRINNARQSNDVCDMRQAVGRVDPLTGRLVL